MRQRVFAPMCVVCDVRSIDSKSRYPLESYFSYLRRVCKVIFRNDSLLCFCACLERLKTCLGRCSHLCAEPESLTKMNHNAAAWTAVRTYVRNQNRSTKMNHNAAAWIAVRTYVRNQNRSTKINHNVTAWTAVRTYVRNLNR